MKPPIVTRVAREKTDFPLDHYSYSTFVKFSTNPILFKINYLNGEYIDTLTGVTGLIGKAFHSAMECYYGVDKDLALQEGLEAGLKLIDEYPLGFLEFSKTIPTKQDAQDLFSFGFTSYVSERSQVGNLIECEAMIEEDIRVEWNGQTVDLPVKLKGYIDRVNRVDGKICITDYKTCRSFSDLDKIDGAKILQAVTYYFLCYAKYGEAPHSMTFEEVKLTKNRDGSPQVKDYTILYDDNELFFNFWFRMYDDVTRAINGEMVYVPNVYTVFDNEVSLISYIHRLDVSEEAALLMEKLKVKSITDLLKAKMESAGNLRALLSTAERQFILSNINYENMTIEERIRTKMMEHGMVLKFDSKIEGHSVALYRYTPTIGLKMSRLSSYVSDVEQVIGKSGVRILAPIPNSSFVGFEIPKDVRTFPDNVIESDGYNLAIGVDIYGDDYRFDITTAPHMLIAGSTGSGKSVFLSSIIKQLSQVENTKIHLFDPKMVELSKFREIATDYQYETQYIYVALEALVKTMNKRYEILAKAGVRNIKEYHESGGKMTYQFIVIDEFGDLVLSNEIAEGSSKKESINLSKEIIHNVLVLAQKARAAGIHLILATQRPSVDIITGSIKSNFPTKVMFRMAKEVDSRVLADISGGEKLLGNGDMLFIPGGGDVIRLQGYNL